MQSTYELDAAFLEQRRGWGLRINKVPEFIISPQDTKLFLTSELVAVYMCWYDVHRGLIGDSSGSPQNGPNASTELIRTESVLRIWIHHQTQILSTPSVT